mgnify:CR=1 FL=1
MKKCGTSLFEKLIIPIIIILAIGFALLLVLKRKIINLLTGLTVTDIPNTPTNVIILIGVVAIVFLLFYKYKK